MNERKKFFSPGDIVTLKQKGIMDNVPNMMVVRKDKKLNIRISNADDTGTEQLKGIICCWFTESKELQQATFSTKDLVLVQKSESYNAE